MISALLFDQQINDDRQVWEVCCEVPCFGRYWMLIKAENRKQAKTQAFDHMTKSFPHSTPSLVLIHKENWP